MPSPVDRSRQEFSGALSSVCSGLPVSDSPPHPTADIQRVWVLCALGCKAASSSDAEHILALLSPAAALTQWWPPISLCESFLLASLGFI